MNRIELSIDGMKTLKKYLPRKWAVSFRFSNSYNVQCSCGKTYQSQKKVCSCGNKILHINSKNADYPCEIGLYKFEVGEVKDNNYKIDCNIVDISYDNAGKITIKEKKVLAAEIGEDFKIHLNSLWWYNEMGMNFLSFIQKNVPLMNKYKPLCDALNSENTSFKEVRWLISYAIKLPKLTTIEFLKKYPNIYFKVCGEIETDMSFEQFMQDYGFNEDVLDMMESNDRHRYNLLRYKWANNILSKAYSARLIDFETYENIIKDIGDLFCGSIWRSEMKQFPKEQYEVLRRFMEKNIHELKGDVIKEFSNHAETYTKIMGKDAKECDFFEMPITPKDRRRLSNLRTIQYGKEMSVEQIFEFSEAFDKNPIEALRSLKKKPA